MTPDYRALCAELLDELELWSSCHDATDLKDRAGAALDLAQQPVSPPYKLPEAEGPTDEKLADLMPTRFLVNQSASARAIANIGTDEQVAEIRAILDGEAIAYARAVLARWGRPAAELVPEPTDEALANFTAWFCRNYPGPDTLIHRPEWHAPKVFRAAADAIARWGRPTPEAVAVSERLPGPEDCNEQGRCWLGGRQMGSGTTTWLLGYPAWAERFPDVHRFWLPANALPTPEATND